MVGNVFIVLSFLLFNTYLLHVKCMIRKLSLHSQDHPKEWCVAISSTPEPSFLFYNRMPKAGSTTMQQILHDLSIANYFTSWNAEGVYWTDFADYPEIKHQFISKIRSTHIENKVYIANGHWSQYVFPLSTFDHQPIEYIQLIRNCSTFAHSLFYYILFDNSHAVAARKISNEAYLNYTKNYLKIGVNQDKYQVDESENEKNLYKNMTIDECLNSYKCIHRSQFFHDFHSETLRYLSGNQVRNDPNYSSSSSSNYHQPYNQTYNAIMNLYNPRIFTIVGVLEYLEQYIEILECIYPTIFHGILKYFHKQQTHSRSSSLNQTSHEGVNHYISNLCHQMTNNSYQLVYNHAVNVFLERYQYMKHHHTSCCRKRNVEDVIEY